MGIDVHISLWWNHGGRSTEGNSLALPSMPDLGDHPRAWDVMKALGVKFEKADPRPVVDTIIFRGCSKVPDCKEPWMMVFVDGNRIQ